MDQSLDFCVYSSKYRQLLCDLKNTVEGLLVTQVANVWTIYGGLNRLHSIMVKIFKHGCKIPENEGGVYKFIEGLEWLQPETAKSYFHIECEYRPHIPPHLKRNKSSIWVYRNLENHSLSQKLSWLLSNQTHLYACYHSYAFLCQQKYSEATLICLRALERNQASFISEIDPYLFLDKKDAMKAHRRCSSFPDNYFKRVFEEKTSRNVCDGILDGDKEDQNINYSGRISIQGKFKPWKSMPILNSHFENKIIRVHCQSKTMPNTPEHMKKTESQSLKLKHSLTHKKYTKIRGGNKVLFDNLFIVEHTPPQGSSQVTGNMTKEDLTHTYPLPRKSTRSGGLSTSPLQVVESFLPKAGEKDYKKLPKKSFIEDGGMSVLPMSTGYFPKPAKGQSLLSFLCTSHLNRTNAELDRENAHFSISEAIISAVEQIRCKCGLKEIDEQMDDSDPEISDLKQKIRLRRTAKAIEKHRKAWADKYNDITSETTTTASPLSTSSASSPTDSCTSLSSWAFDDDLSDSSQIEQSITVMSSNRLSASTTTLCSELDLSRNLSSVPFPLPPRGTPDGASTSEIAAQVDVSAEGVAISLIRKFSDKQLPKASDLEWLVSEEDAPQALLPLPKSWPVSPDSCEENMTPLRGTLEWAPPRPQIIFTPHPPQRKKLLIAKQNYRCAGCSMKVSSKYAARFRYCEYLGRYFCTGCHTNQLAIIPGKVLQKWDFGRYPVSTFSYRLLEQMYTDPLFHVFELNKSIAKLSKNLQICNHYRQSLYYMKDFVFSCKYAETIKHRLEQERAYILTDPGVYSINDLVNVKKGTMKEQLAALFQTCCRHTAECKICLARGFICEICNANDVIFPWQMKLVARCSRCGSCYHLACWNPSKDSCRKCLRLQKKKESIAK
nr:unnamed protein product [Callosobruchus analis]